MQRRKFIQATGLAGIAVSMPGWLKEMPVPGNADTGFLKMELNPSFPQFNFFSIDSLGKNKLSTNIIWQEKNILPQAYISSKENRITNYRLAGQPANALTAWQVNEKNNSFTIISNYHPDHTQPFLFEIEQHANHATLLGVINQEDGSIRLPGVFHFPDMGSLRVTCNLTDVSVQCSAQRFIEHSFVKIHLPAATAQQKKIIYQFDVAAIHPQIKNIERDERYDCFRRNFISIFQLNPFLKILANNTASDACAFTLYKYAEVAAYTPPLVKGLSALDLIRMTLDRYLQGQLGYGMLGYDYDKTWDIPETATNCNSLDSYPSLLIAACTYVIANNDRKWFVENYSKIKAWSAKMLATDKDCDGLLEFCLSGNSGSWKGDKTQRPANWWDTIGFGHKDAYSNALAYHALILLEKANNKYGSGTEAFFLKRKQKS
jgi:hypothetical protein